MHGPLSASMVTKVNDACDEAFDELVDILWSPSSDTDDTTRPNKEAFPRTAWRRLFIILLHAGAMVRAITFQLSNDLPNLHLTVAISVFQFIMPVVIPQTTFHRHGPWILIPAHCFAIHS